MEKRNALCEHIHAAGIQISVHYPAEYHFFIYKNFGAISPQTDNCTDNEVTLPMYAVLIVEQVDFICDTVEKGVAEIYG